MKELNTSGVQAAASRFLSRRGYDVLATGWKSAARTADIVAKDGKALVCAKVRSCFGVGAIRLMHLADAAHETLRCGSC